MVRVLRRGRDPRGYAVSKLPSTDADPLPDGRADKVRQINGEGGTLRNAAIDRLGLQEVRSLTERDFFDLLVREQTTMQELDRTRPGHRFERREDGDDLCVVPACGRWIDRKYPSGTGKASYYCTECGQANEKFHEPKRIARLVNDSALGSTTRTDPSVSGGDSK